MKWNADRPTSPQKMLNFSIGSSGWVGEGGKKHEIYLAAFGGYLFYDLFLQGWGGGAWPLGPPGSPTEFLFKIILLVNSVAFCFRLTPDKHYHRLIANFLTILYVLFMKNGHVN